MESEIFFHLPLLPRALASPGAATVIWLPHDPQLLRCGALPGECLPPDTPGPPGDHSLAVWNAARACGPLPRARNRLRLGRQPDSNGCGSAAERVRGN